jgi:PST family polysaccharide transporter
MVLSQNSKDPVVPIAPALEPSARSSYGQILRSSAIIGGSSVFNVALGVVRTKIAALLLGPAGVGVVGLYNSIVELTRSVASMGINSSAVRQIAESAASGNTQRAARTMLTVRRLALCLGLVGAGAVAAASYPISELSFGDTRHAGSIALLAVAVLCSTISAGQLGLLQGKRRVADLARSVTVGAILGTALSIPILYYFRERGMALFVVVAAGAAALASWWYARETKAERVALPWREMRTETEELLKLGLAFTTSALMSLGTGYLIRVLVLRKLGADAAGFYQAAWSIGGLYAGFILQAMGADFFPRLTAIANDNEACNRMVNEQTEVGLWVAIPGLLATLTFAPVVIHLFYSGRFGPAVDLLRWNCLGLLLRVAAWPIGFIILAKGERRLYIVTELVSGLAYLGLVWIGLYFFGLVGTSVGFFAVYVFYLIMLYAVGWRLSGFRWSPKTARVAIFGVPLIAGVFAAGCFLPGYVATPLGAAVTAGACYYSLKKILALVALENLPAFAGKIAIWLRLSPKNELH